MQEEIENRTINLVISLTGYRKVSGFFASILQNESVRLQGTADIIVDGLIIHDLHVVEWEGSLFVTMPKYAEDGIGTMKQISSLKEEGQERILDK